MIDKVIHILAEFTEAAEEKIIESSSLTVDLGLSSLDVVNVIVAFEEEFDIEIPDEKIRELATVEDVVRYLESKK